MDPREEGVHPKYLGLPFSNPSRLLVGVVSSMVLHCSSLPMVPLGMHKVNTMSGKGLESIGFLQWRYLDISDPFPPQIEVVH